MKAGQRRSRRFAAMTLMLLFASGCGSYRATNRPLERYDPEYGYRPRTTQAQRPAGDVLLLLAFSGGGTRAAAFSYGVLQELRDTQVTVDGQQKRMLDEIDLITSVSGGSFTSAYYALYGDRIFQDYEQKFLRRNIQRRLLLELLRPSNWFRLAGTFFDRTELAIQLYDDEIFNHATFADLQAARGPFIQINAADLAAGSRFTFFQPQFDFICSDLSKFSVARAVAASSAVPGLFTAVTLQNYAGKCDFQRPKLLDEALASRRQSPRRYRYAKTIENYLDPDLKFIHLVDGGIADNLGLRGPLDNILVSGGLFSRLQNVGAKVPSHIVVIVVNAEVHPKAPFSMDAATPSIAIMLNAVSGTQIYSYNFETLELLRESLAHWAEALPPNERGEKVQTHVIEVAFESIESERDREFFNEVATSFTLHEATIDRLISAGRTLLRESSEFQGLVTSLKHDDQIPPTVGSDTAPAVQANR